MVALAHALGKTVAEIGELDLDELALWVAWFAEYDPTPRRELRADLRAGVLAATVANSALGSKGGWKAGDFMPSLKDAANRVGGRSEEAMEKAMIAWCANVGGEVKVE